MLQKELAYIVGLAENKTYTINGETYSENQLHRVAPYVPRAATIEVNGLDSIVKLVRNELETFGGRILFIRVEGPRRVFVFTELDGDMEREGLYHAGRCGGGGVPARLEGQRGREGGAGLLPAHTQAHCRMGGDAGGRADL